MLKAKAMADDKELTIWEHLSELRSRIFKMAAALIVGTIISLIFAERVLLILEAPLGDKVPQAIYPTEGFVVYFRVSLIGGVVLAMPVMLYQIIRFVLPGLLPHEKKYLYFLLPGATICYAAGVAFAAFLMLPAAVTFLQGFMSSIIENRWTLDNYISFVTRVMFWMGIVFQMPLLMFFLAKLNVVTAKKLGRWRKYAILVNAIVAAMVTPTPDPVNMMIVMIPLCLLYEVGVILARLAVVGRKPAGAEGASS